MIAMNDVKYLPQGYAAAADRAAAPRGRGGHRSAALTAAGHAARVYKPYTMLLVGMLNWTDVWYRTEGPMKPKELCERITQLFLHGFLADGAA